MKVGFRRGYLSSLFCCLGDLEVTRNLVTKWVPEKSTNFHQLISISCLNKQKTEGRRQKAVKNDRTRYHTLSPITIVQKEQLTQTWSCSVCELYWSALLFIQKNLPRKNCRWNTICNATRAGACSNHSYTYHSHPSVGKRRSSNWKSSYVWKDFD